MMNILDILCFHSNCLFNRIQVIIEILRSRQDQISKSQLNNSGLTPRYTGESHFLWFDKDTQQQISNSICSVEISSIRAMLLSYSKIFESKLFISLREKPNRLTHITWTYGLSVDRSCLLFHLILDVTLVWSKMAQDK